MIRSTNDSFQITFENELEVSIIYGQGSYSSNRGKEIIYPASTAEVCIFHGDKTIFGNNGNNGWLSPNKIAAIISMASTAKPEDFPTLGRTISDAIYSM